MAPKEKDRVCCGRSKKSPKNNFPHRKYSETILHRLRPRIHRLHRASETIYKVRASETRRKRNRLSAKRCVQYKKKRRYRGNRNRGPRVNPSKKSAGDFRSKNTVVRPIQISETSAVAEIYRKQTSFIRAVKDYLFSTFREGTEWAKNYVCRAFRRDNKFPGIPEVPRIEERNAISSSSSRVIQPGQNDYKDKTRRRYKTTNNQLQDDDGVARSTGNSVTSKGYAINVSGENPGNFLVASNRKHRRSTVATNHTAMCSQANDRSRNFVNKEGQANSQSRRKRRKGGRPNKRIVRKVVRYNRMAEIISERHPYVRSNSYAVINLLKPCGDVNIENGNDCVDSRESNFYAKESEMGINELDNRGIIPFDETVSSESEEVMRYGKKKDQFWEPSTENNTSEKNIENKY